MYSAISPKRSVHYHGFFFGWGKFHILYTFCSVHTCLTSKYRVSYVVSLQVFTDSLLLSIELLFNNIRQVTATLVVQELLAFLDIFHPVVFG